MKRGIKPKPRRNIKDSVFTDLFRDKKYTLQLYKALHPEDKNVTTKDIKIVTLKAIVVNDIYNDLGMIIKDKIIFLLESQSTWSVNILVRLFLYLANTYKNYLTKNKVNLYGTKKVKLPMPELYVIYVGKDKIKNKTISLNKEYFSNKSPIDLKIKVITESEKNNIVGEYIEFSRITNKLVKKYGYKKVTAEKIVNECIKKNVLTEYLEDRKEEVIDIMGILFNQDTVTEFYENEIYENGKAEGMKQGSLKTIVNMFKKGIIKITDAAKELGVSEKEFMKLAKA
ncbi:MAG: hypothetical protein J6M39_03800 [Lachnospiraceae bacterium]|nr:hypothetical protein [Lachnospiraceae bacterium]